MSEMNALEEADDCIEYVSRASNTSVKMEEIVPEGIGFIKWPSGE
jgi:hypothetical protein